MSAPRPIRTPLGQQWRRVRYQLIPVLVFGAAALGTIWLWGRHTGLPNAVGEVEVVRFEIKAPADGTLVATDVPRWDRFDTVKAGAVIARLDDRLVLSQWATLQAEVARLQKELAAAGARERQALAEAAGVRADRQRQWVTDLRQLGRDVERLRLERLDRQAERAVYRAEYQRRKAHLEAMETLAGQQVVARFELFDARLLVDVLEQRIQGAETAIARLDRDLAAAREGVADLEERLAAFPPQPRADLDALLGPMRAAITVAEARAKELDVQRRSLELRAPCDGTISQIYCRPGEAVTAGMPIVALVADRDSFHVVSYVREHQRLRPKVGMPVTVRVRSLPVQTLRGRIAQVGPSVEPVPAHHLADPANPEWGWPVRIVIPDSAEVHPGELVDVSFEPVQ